MTSPALYGTHAELYDLIYHSKDYAAETERLWEILRREGMPGGGRLLEAACGTGNFLAHMQGRCRVVGVDRSADVLAHARRKLPGVSLLQADMAALAFEEAFDAVACLFSSLGYLEPGAALEGAARSFWRALRPGGVLLVEPWLAPEAVIDGRPSVQTYQDEDIQLARAVVMQVEGRRSILDFHWLVARRDVGVEHLEERHVLWMSTHEELLETFAAAGFEVRWEEPGLQGHHGLLVGRRT